MAATTPRPYLSADERRRQLLDATARLFAREGFAGTTMVALAAEARVSRRLVYDHFPDLSALYEAFFADRVAIAVDVLDRARAEAGEDPIAVLAATVRSLVRLPEPDRRAFRLVAVDSGVPELDPLRDRLRTHVLARWRPLLADLPDEVASAVVWTLLNGFLALADLAARGEVTPEVAVAVATALVADLPARLARPIETTTPMVRALEHH